MNHPKPEEWAGFAYGDCDPEESARLDAHAVGCPDCRRELEALRTVQGHLDGYSLPESFSRPRGRSSGRWLLASAASVAFVLGGLAMRWAVGSAPGEAELLVKLRPVLDQELKAMLASQNRAPLSPTSGLDASGMQKADAATTDAWRSAFAGFLALYGNDRAEDRAILAEAVRTLDQQRRADYIRLRNDLETVALTASDQLSRTRSDLTQLAALTTSVDRPTQAHPNGNNTKTR